MEARRRKASALRLRFSQSLARRRQRLSHAMVRSTIQRLGKTESPWRIGALDDLDVDLPEDLCEGRLKYRPLIAAVGIELLQERIQAEQCGHHQDAAVTILDVGGMNDGVQQQAERIDENVALLALDLLARIIAMRIDPGPPFSALLTLWLSMMAARRAGFAFGLLATLHIERVMDALQRAVPIPQSRNSRAPCCAAAGPSGSRATGIPCSAHT